jgi:hypothetical protein
MRKRKSKHRQGIPRCHSLIDYINKTFKLKNLTMSVPILMRLIQTEDSNEWSEPISGEEYLARLQRGEPPWL